MYSNDATPSVMNALFIYLVKDKYRYCRDGGEKPAK